MTEPQHNNPSPPPQKKKKLHTRPAMTQISGRPPSLIRVFAVRLMDKVPRFRHADSEDSDQARRMSRLI